MFNSLKAYFQLGKELGRGRFGVVHHCYSPLADDYFACKSIHKHSLSSDPADRSCLDAEPKILRLLTGCPNVLHLHTVYEDDDYLHLVTDLCDGSDLYNRLSSRDRFSEAYAASILKQLMVAIACYHRLGVAHRDIKPDNILFDSRRRLRPKLVDHGSAELFGVSHESTSLTLAANVARRVPVHL